MANIWAQELAFEEESFKNVGEFG